MSTMYELHHKIDSQCLIDIMGNLMFVNTIYKLNLNKMLKVLKLLIYVFDHFII